MKYDYVIVGAGLFGCVFAHEMRKRGKSVVVIEKRDHIGGNCYTEERSGIHVHKYGAHIFHTKSKRIWDYINQFATFNNYVHKVVVNVNGLIYSFPVNLMTMYQIWPGDVKTPADARRIMNKQRAKIDNPANFEEYMLSQVGHAIYALFFKEYTKKQWRRDPKEVPASVGSRMPVRFTFDDRYFGNDYQGIPIGGYTQIFEKMLDGVEVHTKCDFFSDQQVLTRLGKKLVFSGCIDELHGYKFGHLDYRTLKFDHITTSGDYQGTAVVNHTRENVQYTRVTEHKHFEGGNHDLTVVSMEYPVEYQPGRIPYYPINDEKNTQLYERYREITGDVILGGRLGAYRYYDMDQVVAQALRVSNG